MVPCGIFRAATSVTSRSGGGSCIRENKQRGIGWCDARGYASYRGDRTTGACANNPPQATTFGGARFCSRWWVTTAAGYIRVHPQARLFFSDQVQPTAHGGRAVRWYGWPPRRPGGGAAPLE